MENRYLADLPQVLTVEEIAGILRIGRNSAYQLVRNNEIQYFRAGRSIRIPKKALILFLEEHKKC